MRHEILGEIKSSNPKNTDWSASYFFHGREIRIGICPDAEPLQVAVALAANAADRLESLNQLALDYIATNLLDTYNSGWNEYDEVQEDGSLKEVVNPELSATEFKAKLTLAGFNVTGDSSVTLFYDDAGLFWGHSVVVEMIDGAEFTLARATLFG